MLFCLGCGFKSSRSKAYGFHSPNIIIFCILHIYALIPFLQHTVNKRKKNSIHPIHLSMKPPASVDIDFDTLGLKFPQTHDNNFVVARLGWAPPRAEVPDLPFHVSSGLI